MKFITINNLDELFIRKTCFGDFIRLTPLAREIYNEKKRGNIKMRTPFLAGNWKMNKGIKETTEFLKLLVNELKGISGRDIVVAPPFTALSAAGQILDGSNIMLSAQNCHHELKGAFTGEISVEFIRETGAKFVIIGHSERRQYFGETDEGVNKKLHTIINAGLYPILCVGETLAERERNITLEIVSRQLKGGLVNVSGDKLMKVVIAYEPVWAIGTGKTATPEIAQEVHGAIRKYIESSYGLDSAINMRILYGGSVTPENISALMKERDIDGGLIGGASMKLESFVKIVKDCI